MKPADRESVDKLCAEYLTAGESAMVASSVHKKRGDEVSLLAAVVATIRARNKFRCGRTVGTEVRK